MGDQTKTKGLCAIVLSWARAMAGAVVVCLSCGTDLAHAEGRERIWVVGSSTMYQMTAHVAETFLHSGERAAPLSNGPRLAGAGRETVRRWISPVLESTGTGGGIKQFCGGLGAGFPDIVLASRPMTEEERTFCARHDVTHVVALAVGNGGLVVINQAQGPEFRLTRRHLWLATAAWVPYHGQMVPNFYHSWREIDVVLPNIPIQIYGPPLTSGTRDALVGLVMEPECMARAEVANAPDERRRELCLKVREDGAYMDAGESDDALLRRVQASPQAVGIVGFHVMSEDSQIKAASVEAVPPTFSTVISGIYPLVRPLIIYVKADHLPWVPGMSDFVRIYTSEEMIGPGGALTDRGLVPLPDMQRAETQAKGQALR